MKLNKANAWLMPTLLIAVACMAALFGGSHAQAAESKWETVVNTFDRAIPKMSLFVENGVPYVAVKDASFANKLSILKSDGNNWQFTGFAGLSDGVINFVSLQVHGGVPYVAYTDEAQFDRLVVKKYDGGWQNVGAPGLTTGTTRDVNLFEHNGTFYLAYMESYKGKMKKLNGTVWEDFGGGTITPGFIENISLYIEDNGTPEGVPYIAYLSESRVATVMKYEGGSWTTVGNANFSPGMAFHLTLYVDDGTPYIAYSDNTAQGKIRVMMLGDSNQWTTVGSAGFTSHNPGPPSLVVSDGIPYVSYMNTVALNRLEVSKFDGSNWVPAGDTGVSPGYVRAHDLFVEDGIVYAAFVDESNVFKMMKLNHGITYHGNGNDGGTAPVEDQFFDPGFNASVRGNEGILAKTGYTFTGWNTQPDGNGTGYAAGGSMPIGTAGVDLYAQWEINRYKVTYVGNGHSGGSVPPEVSYDYNTDVMVEGMGTSFRYGHTFVGWNTDPDGNGIHYNFGETLRIGTADVTLYAQWQINSYTISYDGNMHTDGSVPASVTQHYDTDMTVAENTGGLTRTGHTFLGWNTEPNGLGTDYNVGQTLRILDSDVLYAKWQPIDYSVNFVSNGGSEVDSQTVTFGQLVNQPADPARIGHTFSGWYSDSGLTTPYSFTSTMGASNLTLYAKWTANSYNVAYDGNGSTAGSVPGGSSHEFATEVTVPGPGDLAKTGHAFAGWNTAADGSGTAYAEGGTFEIGAEHVTLYAQWTVNGYTITYEGIGSDEGSPPAASSYDYQSSVTVSGSGSLRKTGYSLAGWNTAADGSGTTYAPGDKFTMDAADMTLYAVWTINSYDVGYDGNGSTEGSVPGESNHEFATEVTVLGPGDLAKTGHTFAGWNTAADGSGTAYAEGGTFEIGAEHVTLYAQWTVNGYTITYEGIGSDEGSPPAASSYDYQSSVTVSGSGSLRKTGYSLAGWNTAADGSGTTYAPGDKFTMDAADMTLYAVWTINSYDVGYDGNGSTEGSVPGESNHEFATEVTVLGPGDLAKTGHTFAGWNTAADGSGTAYAEGGTFEIGSDHVTLYAQWTVNNYTITYAGNGNTGGEAPAASSHAYGSNATAPDRGTLEKTGYTFTSWNTEPDGSGTPYPIGDAIPIGSGNLTLYAQWASNDALLANLLVDQGDFAPAFSPLQLQYDVDLRYMETDVTISFTQMDPRQTITVTGAVYVSATGLDHMYFLSDVGPGETPIEIEVKAEDGTTNVYAVTLHRLSGDDASLSGIVLSVGALRPAFAPGTTEYTANVPNNVKSLAVTATASDPRATISINGQAVPGGQPSGDIPLTVGDNEIRIVVNAQDGTELTYTVKVRRAAPDDTSPSEPSVPTGNTTVPSAPRDPVISDNGQIKLPAGASGEVRLKDEIVIFIPSGASPEELTLTIKKVQDTEGETRESEQLRLLSSIYEISANVEKNFVKPIAIRLAFDSAGLEGDGELAVYRYNEADGKWSKVAGGDLSGHTLTVEVQQAGTYAVFASHSTAGSETASDFNDISGHWAAAAIGQATSAGIVSGYSDGTFRPNQTVTRAEFAVMLVNALGLSEGQATVSFTDAGHIGGWAQNAVGKAVQAGIIKGNPDGSFRPNERITRAEMAVMIAGALALPIDAGATSGFSDDKVIPNWARGHVSAIRELRLVQGKGANAFDPLEKMTRAEAVTVLLNVWAWRTED